MHYKAYKIITAGRVLALVKFPADESNCWWANVQVWNNRTGFIKSAQYLDEDGNQFDLVEV